MWATRSAPSHFMLGTRACDKITCSTCRVEVEVHQAGVAGLPKNFALLSLIAACVASVSNRVIARKLEREQKKGGRGRGTGEEETPAYKRRDLENAP